MNDVVKIIFDRMSVVGLILTIQMILSFTSAKGTI
jgi:hypothetical protein